MQAAKCGLDLNRNELANSLDFDMILKLIRSALFKT